MADYSYAQLSRMQQDAVQRVQEMRKKAKAAADDAAHRFSQEPQNARHDEKTEAACPKQQGSAAQCCCKKQKNASDFIADLLAGKGLQADERDKALILSVCFLLYAEQADEELIPALLYLLT